MKKRKPRKNPLKEVGDHRDKMTMRAHQRVAFKHNALVASASESTPPRDEEAIRAQNRADIEAYRAYGLTAKDPAKDPVCLGDFVDAEDGRVTPGSNPV